MLHIIANSLIILLDLISWAIIIQCILSWIPSLRNSKAYYALSILTDPIEDPIRNFLYRYVQAPIDFSPIVAILLIEFAKRLIYIIF